MNHTINTKEIAAELAQLGHRVRSIINGKHSYANVVSNKMNTDELTKDTNKVLTQPLNEYKSMFNQIIQQHSMTLNM
jgi:hypothetical protein